MIQLNPPTTDQEKRIAAIKANNEVVLKQLYLENFPKVEKYILLNGGTKMLAKDIYQEAFMAVWNNVRLDKFVPKGDSALNGYLYSIAKNKWIDYLRSNEYKKKRPLDENSLKTNFKEEISKTELEDESENRLNKVIETFNSLGKACKELLTVFYYEKKSLREIAKELKIGEASARNKKYRCIEKLRAMVLTTN